MLSRTEKGQDVITELGHELLARFVTDTRAPVYALRESLPSAISAAAMARLSRCADDLRVIILREFCPSFPAIKSETGKEQELLRRVITAYGDDSVQQLAGLYVVVQCASNLLTKLLERPRIGAAYLEQSTRYIFFDQMVQAEDGQSHYRYHVPAELSAEDQADYRQSMDALFERYGRVVYRLHEFLVGTSSEPRESRDLAWRNAIRAQACDAARAMLPAATTSTVGIFASAQALDSLIMHLSGSHLSEARQTGADILAQVRQVAPVFFERTDMLERGAATTAYLRRTADDFASKCQASASFRPTTTPTAPVTLTAWWPEDERSIVSALAFAAGYELVSEPSDKEIQEWLAAYAGERLNRRHRPGRIFEDPHYTFNFRTAYAEFRDLQRHRLVDGFEWQQLQPGDDYEVPDLIAKAGLETLYHESFAQSRELHSRLSSYGSAVAQYAVLFGHKLNWRWTLNFREAMHVIELRTTPQGHPSYRRICQAMYEQISSVHPHLAATMRFVNCGEDPELTRLAAERATAAKLNNFGK